ncbi:Uncharacterised protein [Candidatus Burarchaeum australiense]|nr:Uncharacterised protein [Candidatus Burarchaeum australiense]
MRKEMIALAFVAVLLAGCTFPAPPGAPPGTGATDFSQVWQNWQGVAAIAVIMSAFFVSLGYMLGSFFNNEMIKGWAKSELLQVFASALIVGGVIWLVAMMTALSGSIAGYTGLACPAAPPMSNSPNMQQNANLLGLNDKYAASELIYAPCHILVAQLYLEIMYENLFEETRDILITGSLLSAISNFNLTVEMIIPPWTSITFVPFASVNMVFETLATVFDMLTKTMLLLKFQIYFLSFVWRALFPMLLVLGVIMRTFWFSRRLGGLLIAFAIGIYVAFPLLYTLAFYILDGTSAHSYVVSLEMDKGYWDVTSDQEWAIPKGVVPDAPVPTATGPAAPVPHAESNIMTIASRLHAIEDKNYIGDTLSIAATAIAPVQAGIPDQNNWLVGDGGVLEKMAKLLVFVTFVPFIALMGTIAFIKGLSPLLGGDVEIAGITHLI